MTIFVGSRYAAQQIVNAPLSDGTTAPTVFGPTPQTFSRFIYYQVQAGDRYDILAARFLGDPMKWWMIADLNPQVFYPENLQPGAMLRIPTS